MRTVFVMLALLLFFVPAIEAQNVTLSFNNMPLKTALDKLFSETGKTYTLDAGINPDANIANVSIVDVPFDIALKGILKSVGLQYKSEAAAYSITAVSIAPKPTSTATPTIATNRQTPTVPAFDMRKREVMEMMGKPLKEVGSIPGSETCYYPDCTIQFRNGRVLDVRWIGDRQVVSVGSGRNGPRLGNHGYRRGDGRNEWDGWLAGEGLGVSQGLMRDGYYAGPLDRAPTTSFSSWYYERTTTTVFPSFGSSGEYLLH